MLTINIEREDMRFPIPDDKFGYRWKLGTEEEIAQETLN